MEPLFGAGGEKVFFKETLVEKIDGIQKLNLMGGELTKNTDESMPSKQGPDTVVTEEFKELKVFCCQNEGKKKNQVIKEHFI